MIIKYLISILLFSLTYAQASEAIPVSNDSYHAQHASYNEHNRGHHQNYDHSHRIQNRYGHYYNQPCSYNRFQCPTLLNYAQNLTLPFFPYFSLINPIQSNLCHIQYRTCQISYWPYPALICDHQYFSCLGGYY